MTSAIFTLSFSDGSQKIDIEWPIARQTSKAVLVVTPGGEVWLPLWRFQKRRWPVDEADALVGLIKSVSASSPDARVRVWRSGAGSSGKSHKFQFAVQSGDGDQVQVRRRCFTLPVSQIKGSKGSWNAPAWLLQKRLASDSETLVRPEWPGLEAVESQIRQAVISAKTARREAEERSNQMWLAKQKEREDQKAAEAAELSRLAEVVETEGELALAFCRRNFNLGELSDAGLYFPLGWPTWPPAMNLSELKQAEQILLFARVHPKFEMWKARNAGKNFAPKPPKPPKVRVPDLVLENVRVQWVDWGGTSNKRVRSESDHSGCTVKFFGSKREIVTAEGEVVTKMKGPNLIIHTVAA